MTETCTVNIIAILYTLRSFKQSGVRLCVSVFDSTLTVSAYTAGWTPIMSVDHTLECLASDASPSHRTMWSLALASNSLGSSLGWSDGDYRDTEHSSAQIPY